MIRIWKLGRRPGKGPAVQEDLAPNLIAMIDIMFLLLLFFMLGADMGQRQLEDVVLPQASLGAKCEDRETGDTIVNVYHRCQGPCGAYEGGGVCTERGHWRIGVGGNDYAPAGIGALIKGRADLHRDPLNPRYSAGKVMVRADRSALYEYVQKVIEACSQAGIYKVDIGTAERTS